MAETHNLPSSPDVPHWHAGYNQPGYFPEAEPGVYAGYHAARDALAEDMEAAADATETWANPHNCDDIPCPTYGEECPWQTAGAIRAEREDLIASDGPQWSGQAGGLAYWVTACGDPACVVDLVARSQPNTARTTQPSTCSPQRAPSNAVLPPRPTGSAVLPTAPIRWISTCSAPTSPPAVSGKRFRTGPRDRHEGPPPGVEDAPDWSIGR